MDSALSRRKFRFVPAAPKLIDGKNVDEYKQFTVKAPGEDRLSALYTRMSRPHHGPLGLNSVADAYYVPVGLHSFNCINMVVDGQNLGGSIIREGTAQLYDWRRQWSPEIIEPFETVSFLVPFTRFDELHDEYKIHKLKEFAFPHQIGPDEGLYSLARAFLPALRKPSEASVLFVEHLFSALIVYLAQLCGHAEPLFHKGYGRLSAWQERRAKDMLSDDFQSELSLGALAQACGLSVSHFSRAFKASTGLSPHRWLTEQRLIRVKDLLGLKNHSLAEIALIAGFCDQSHLTRVFTKAVGTSPGNWRRTRTGG